MSMLQSGVEYANWTIEAMPPDDQVTFFTLFCIIAVVVIVALTFLVGIVSCPQDFTGHPLGPHWLSGACRRNEGGGEKGAVLCRHHSGLTLVPGTPAVSFTESASSIDSGGSEETACRAALPSSSSTSIDTIKQLRTGDGVTAAVEHVYDVIPDRKSRRRQNDNSYFNSAQMKRVFQRELISLKKDDHYQTPSMVVCPLQCCHGNTNPEIKQDPDETRHSEDFLHIPERRRAATPTHSHLDLKNCVSNGRKYHYEIIPSYAGDKHATNKQTTEYNRITVTSDGTTKMWCEDVNTTPETHQCELLDIGQYAPVRSQSHNLGHKAIHKHTTKPRFFAHCSNVTNASDETRISSPRLSTPRSVVRSPRFTFRNELLSQSSYQNQKHTTAKDREMLMQKPDVIRTTDWKYQGHQQRIPTFDHNSVHPSKRGFSECFCTRQNSIRVEGQAVHVPRRECQNSSKPGEQSSQKDDESKSPRTEKFTLDCEPLERYATWEPTRPYGTSEYSSQYDTSELTLQYDSNSSENSTRHKTSEPTRHYDICEENRTNLSASNLTRPSTTDKKGHHFSGRGRRLPLGQTRQSFPGQAMRSAGVGKLTCWAAVSRAQRGHALSSGTAEPSLPTPSVHHRLKSKSKPQCKIQSDPAGLKDHHGGKHAGTQKHGNNPNTKLKPEHGQHHPAFSDHGLECPALAPYDRKEQPSLDRSFIFQSSNISADSVAEPDDSAQEESVWSSHSRHTEPWICCQETTHWTHLTRQVPERQPNSSTDFLFKGILPFKDTCRRVQGHGIEREELQAERENPNLTCSSFGDYVIMNNPQCSMTSSEWNADSRKSYFGSPEISHEGVPSGVSNKVLPMFSVRDVTSPYRFQTPADAVQSLKSYIRRNF